MKARRVTRIILALLFLFAGTVHLTDPALFLPLMPPWLPFPFASITISGIFEVLGGLGLLAADERLLILTGWGLTLLLIAIFPANIQMAVANVKIHGFPSHPWMAWARLPLQIVLIWAVLWSTKAWPARQGQNPS